jgi:adenosylmethionine-8-amino-7-oxononanoate aminotransferase
VNFIACEYSYHSNTLGALRISRHTARRIPYEPFFISNVHRVSACYAYRQRKNSEFNKLFVARKAVKLETKFQELGPETIIGFICKLVVGVTLGSVPSIPGYLKAIREVCYKYNALFILDKIISSIRRCDTLYTWQEKDIVPNLQTIRKGLGGRY